MVKTQSQVQEGHFSISDLKEVYFLKSFYYNSSASTFFKAFKATQISIGSFPSKGDIIQLPVLQDICMITVLTCLYQQSQHILLGLQLSTSPNSQVSQHIQQVSTPIYIYQASRLSCIFIQIIRLYVLVVYTIVQFDRQIERMIDRLPELKKNAALLGNTSEEDLDLENKPMEENDEENELDEQFTEDIKSVRSMIAGLNANNKKIQTIKNNYAKAIKSAQEKQNSEELSTILGENSVYQNKIKKKLVEIAESVKVAEQNQPNEPQTRMKKNFHLNLSKQVSDVLQRQQKFEEQFKETVKEKVTRQVKLIDRDIDEQQLQEYINNPQKAQEMLQKKLFGQASITLKNTVCDIQDKLRDIQKLQASVNQCVQLFNELSALVFAQGEKIDSIEANVVACKDYIESADKKLQKAVEHHKCSRKCMCIALIIAAVVIVIIIIVIFATKS